MYIQETWDRVNGRLKRVSLVCDGNSILSQKTHKKSGEKPVPVVYGDLSVKWFFHVCEAEAFHVKNLKKQIKSEVVK